MDPASPDRLVLPELASPARSTTSTSMTDVHSSSTSLSTAEERTDEDYVLTAEISSWELFDMIGPVSAMTTEGLNTESDAKRLMLEAGCLLQKTGHVLSMGDEVRGNKVNALYDKKKLQRIRPVDVFDMAVVDSMMDDAFDIKGLQDVTTALAIKNASALCTEASAVLEGKIGSNTLRLFAMCEAMADMLILFDTFKKIGDLLPYKSGEVVDVAYLAFKVFLMAVSMVVEFATVKIEQGSSRSRRDEEIEPLHHALRHVLSQMSAEDDMTWKMPGSTVEPPNYSECGMHEPYTPNYSECGAPNYSDSESADADAKADLTLPKNDGATTADGAAVTVSDTTITVPKVDSHCATCTCWRPVPADSEDNDSDSETDQEVLESDVSLRVPEVDYRNAPLDPDWAMADLTGDEAEPEGANTRPSFSLVGAKRFQRCMVCARLNERPRLFRLLDRSLLMALDPWGIRYPSYTVSPPWAREGLSLSDWLYVE